MRMLFLAALLLVQSQSGGPVPSTGAALSSAAIYPRFHPRTSGPLSFDINQPARAAFEAVANLAGLSLIFDRDYRAPASPVQLKLQNVDIFYALDSLAAATNTFWVPLGNQTVYIADNNVTKHRDYDLSQTAVLHLTGPTTTQELLDVMNDVRQRSGITSMVAFPKTNSLVLNDSPAKVDSARTRLSELNRQKFGPSATVDRVAAYEKDSTGNVYLLDGSTINLKRAQLNPTFNGLSSLDINEPARTAFETVGAKAGFTVLFDRDFRPTPATIALKLKDVDDFTALDMICLMEKSFWIPMGDHTIFIVEDNSTKRRDFDPTFVDVVHLTGAKTTQDVNDVMNAVRQILNVTSMVANPGANALVYRDTSEKAALVENLIADLDGQLNGSTKGAVHSPSYQMESVTGGSGNVYLLDGSRRNINPLISQLRPTSTSPLSFDINQPSRTAFESIAAMAGLSVIFDADYRPTPATTTLKLSNTDIYTALDIVSTALHTFWVPLGSQTIFVAENYSKQHRDFEPRTLEVVDIPGVQNSQGLIDVMNDVRQVLNVTLMFAVPRTNSLVIFDAPFKVALAKALIADILRSGAAPAMPAVTSVLSLETDSLSSFSNASNAGLKNYSAPATAQLRPSATGTFTLHISADARQAYETLGDSVGLNVVFDPQFAPGQPAAFHLENVDVIQSLDLMGKQTGNFWQVVDSKTIYITPENVPSRRLYESTAVKSFHLTNEPVSDLTSIVNMLRSLMNISNVMTDVASNTIDVRSTTTNLAIVERLLSALDRPAPAR